MPEANKPKYRILVAAGDRAHLAPLLAIGHAVARTRQGQVTVLLVTPDGKRPDWLQLPSEIEGVPIEVQVRQSRNPGKAILVSLRLNLPDLLLLGWQGSPGRGQYLLGSTLDPVIKRAPCNVMVMRIKSRPEGVPADEPVTRTMREIQSDIRSVAIPAAGGRNAVLAIQQALDLGPDVQVTAMFVARNAMGNQEVALGEERLHDILEPWADNPRVKPKIVQANTIVEGILSEAVHHDLLFVGATEESLVERALFGNIPQRIAYESAVPVIIMRRGTGILTSFLRQIRWTIFETLPKLDMTERAEIYLSIWRGARPRIDFYIMITLASAIAALGLIQSSPAVIIGAMLVAPLMSAVIGLGLGVVQGDLRLLRVSMRAVVRGAVLGIVMGLLFGFLVVGGTPTPEMLSRTSPGLLDLAVALVSGAAGAYAISRRGVSAALPGVAIAAALVPPLATVGLCLNLGLWALAGGALLLFIANLTAIGAAGGLVFLWLGFGPGSGERAERRVFRSGIVGTVVLMAALVGVLGLLTESSLRASALDRSVREALAAELATKPGIELVSWEIVGTEGTVLDLDVTVRSKSTISSEVAMAIQRDLASLLDRPLALTLSVIPTQSLAEITPVPTTVLGAP